MDEAGIQLVRERWNTLACSIPAPYRERPPSIDTVSIEDALPNMSDDDVDLELLELLRRSLGITKQDPNHVPRETGKPTAAALSLSCPDQYWGLQYSRHL